MAMTVSERQRRYRSRKEKAGLKRSDSWTDKAGLLAPPSETGAWRQMTLKDLGMGIKKLFLEYEEWEQEVVYAELFEYAKKIEKNLKKAFEAGKVDIVTGND